MDFLFRCQSSSSTSLLLRSTLPGSGNKRTSSEVVEKCWNIRSGILLACSTILCLTISIQHFFVFYLIYGVFQIVIKSQSQSYCEYELSHVIYKERFNTLGIDNWFACNSCCLIISLRFRFISTSCLCRSFSSSVRTNSSFMPTSKQRCKRHDEHRRMYEYQTAFSLLSIVVSSTKFVSECWQGVSRI